MGNLKNKPPKNRVEVEKGNTSRAGGELEVQVIITSFEMVTDIYVDDIPNITGNIIIDITILHSIFYHCCLAHPECFSGTL